MRRNVSIALREIYRRAIPQRKSLKCRHGSPACIDYPLLNVEQTDGNAEFPERQLLDPNHLTQVLQVETSECWHYVQLNPNLVGIPICDEVEPAAAEIPHTANFLEISVSCIHELDVHEPVDLDARLATPFQTIWPSLFAVLGKNPLLELIHGGLPRCLWLCSSGDGALSQFTLLEGVGYGSSRMASIARRYYLIYPKSFACYERTLTLSILPDSGGRNSTATKIPLPS